MAAFSMTAVHLHNPLLSCSKPSIGRRSPGRMSAPRSSHLPRQPSAELLRRARCNLETHSQKAIRQDFGKVQSFHQNEYDQVLRWWKRLELSQQPQGFRDQPKKWLAWSTGMLPDPQFSMQRIQISKVIGLVYVIDDIFDLLGSLEELALFTQVVQRWDNSELILDTLPTDMRFCFHALHNTTNEIAELITKKYGWNPIDSLRKSWVTLFQAFLVEAQWFRSESPPKANEYLENGVISTGTFVIFSHLNYLLGNEGNIKKNALLENEEEIPMLIFQVALIYRLWDDLWSTEDESQDGFDGSYVDYYMKEHHISLQSARKHTNQMVSGAWRELNKEILSENQVSSTMKKAVLNTLSMMIVMYNYRKE